MPSESCFARLAGHQLLLLLLISVLAHASASVSACHRYSVFSLLLSCHPAGTLAHLLIDALVIRGADVETGVGGLPLFCHPDPS